PAVPFDPPDLPFIQFLAPAKRRLHADLPELRLRRGIAGPGLPRFCWGKDCLRQESNLEISANLAHDLAWLLHQFFELHYEPGDLPATNLPGQTRGHAPMLRHVINREPPRLPLLFQGNLRAHDRTRIQ